MPITTIPVPLLNTGPGVLYRAPLGTAVPTNTVAGGIFTDTWAAAWVPLGATEEGTEASYELDSEDIEGAEFIDPLAVVTTGRSIEVAFALLSLTKSSLLAAYNAGTGAATTSGTGATTLTTITPPKPGTEVNCMIGFESTDATYRAVWFNARQVGNASKRFRKGADKTIVPMTFRALPDATSGDPFKEYLAGAGRGA